jgi:hypothetical protein
MQFKVEMLALHVVLLALQVEHEEILSVTETATENVKTTERLVGQHLDFLVIGMRHHHWSDEYLEHELLIPIFRKVITHFRRVKLIKILKRISAEHGLAITVAELKAIEQPTTNPEDIHLLGHAPKPLTEGQSFFEKSKTEKMSEIEIHKIPRKHENNLAESVHIKPFVNSPTTVTHTKNQMAEGDTNVQDKENTQSQLNNASPKDRKAFFFEKFIHGKEEKRLEKNPKVEIAKKKDVRELNFKNQEASLSQPDCESSRRKSGRYNRIIKNAHKSKSKVIQKNQKILRTSDILTPQNLTMASMQQIGMTFANLSDCCEYEPSHPTYENSHNEFETEASNTFPIKMSQIYVEFDSWNNEVIAAKTPVAELQNLDEAMPSLDLEN